MWRLHKLFLLELVSVFTMEMTTLCSHQEAEGKLSDFLSSLIGLCLFLSRFPWSLP